MNCSKRRIVVTGLGTVNPLGNCLEDTWQRLCDGTSGIGPITKFDTSGFSTKIAGEVKNFDPLSFISPKDLRRLDNFIIYALAAAEMARNDAQLALDEKKAERTGVILGSAIGGLETVEREKEIVLASGPRRMSPFAIPSVLANLAPGNVAIRFGAKGPISCAVTACAAGNNAISEAARMIACGYADIMITGGTDAAVTTLAVAGFNSMRAISVRNDEPSKASRPFDADRDGFVISEGSAILILEEMTSAMDRGARIYAEIAGSGSTCDAFHIAAPPPGHPGAAKCMKLALADAGMIPADVDYVNAHGTSTPLNDIYETEAIKAVFGDHITSLAVSSTKSMTGHLLGAAGGIEAIATVKSIEKGIIPPTINMERPDPQCDLDYTPNKAVRRDVNVAMSNSFGFGGVNSVVIFKRFVE
ncbi:MAG: beta-ketoacyl-ACP synthase II [Syntrophales bacterium]|jgi:3-oxoacyl-[acyl-carrier-protein] synthase II|nr:beta-ketoacyl-ACP synthase II [Syntrophales bacterium]MDY0044363.1 beta-ketoacyl-ACP synthase II [Syntrophales bacterium]